MRYIFGGKNDYIAIFPLFAKGRKMAMGEKWLYNTGISFDLMVANTRLLAPLITRRQ
jgi:hypothetical protein